MISGRIKKNSELVKLIRYSFLYCYEQLSELSPIKTLNAVQCTAFSVLIESADA